MKLNKLVALPALLASLSLAACGGGGSSLPAAGNGGTPLKANAKQSLTIRIPIGGPSAASTPSARLRAERLRPMFIDGNSNGNISVYFDGTAMISDVSFATTTAPGPGPSGTGTLPNGGSYNYTSTIAYGNGTDGPTTQLYATITGSYTSIPGSHTIGAVQTNGVCDVGTDPCIPNNDGYVLAEGQTTVNLATGDNGNTPLYLKGVMQSAYFLSTSSSSGSNTLDVVVSDENGTAIPYQKDGSGAPIGYDNGSYQIVEADSNNIVTITQSNSAGYSAPGTSRHGLYGESVTVTCANVGSTTVEAQLVPGDNTAGNVTGFIYNANNYPQASSVLGSVGSDQYFGGSLSVNCTSSGTLTIQ